jgi:hypothetical protein
LHFVVGSWRRRNKSGGLNRMRVLARASRHFCLFAPHMRMSGCLLSVYKSAMKPPSAMKIRSAIMIACLGGMSACQTTLLSNDRIVSETAGVLGVPQSELSISDRVRDGPTNTRYMAADSKTGARYACVINGGGALALGMVNPPTCNKQ